MTCGRHRMELDHLFVCTTQGAPEADKLVEFGLQEGPPNSHPGQGTANRRFGFLNAMIELVWVSNAEEVQSRKTERTQIWERWSGRNDHACPFGICLRPTGDQDSEPPFPAWEYRPSYLPDPLVMHIAEAGIEEPMWVYLNFMRRAQREQWFVEHPRGIGEITGLTLTTRSPLQSNAAHAAIQDEILVSKTGKAHLLEIEFDGQRRNEHMDFRPHLPFVFHL
jgi:hypothetical protein